MILGTALLVAVLLATQAGPDAASEQASAAFASGDYASAERLAMEAAPGVNPGAALYLAGLARFRSGDSAGALALLDKAWDTNDRPAAGAWHFNRGACLYDLGRLGEAESEFVAAASLDDSLAAVSWIDAGFAALDAGATERASIYSENALSKAKGGAAALRADLEARIQAASTKQWEAEYRAGLSAFDEGAFADARKHFLAATALRGDGKSQIMSAACAIQLGDRKQALRELDAALSRPLDDEDARIARDYRDLAWDKLGEAGWRASAQISAGFDSNALQTGFLEPNEFPGANSSSSPSAFATADAGLARTIDLSPGGYSGGISPRMFGTLAYNFDQLAYFAPDARDRSLQLHTLLLSFVAAGENRRIGISLGAQFSFNGLDQFRALQLNGLTSIWGAYDESERLTSRLDLGFEPKLGFNEFDYLSGDRYDAALTQELRISPATFTLGYRFRAELIGTASEAVTTLPPPPPMVCPSDCTLTSIDPFGYTSNTLWLAARATPGARWTFDLSGGVEWRDYTSDNGLLISSPYSAPQEVDRRRRYDIRYFASASASFLLAPGVALTARYDLLLNRSNIDTGAPDGAQCGPPDYSCHLYDAEVRSYDKHVLSVGTAINW